jgi:hypothetical protein
MFLKTSAPLSLINTYRMKIYAGSISLDSTLRGGHWRHMVMANESLFTVFLCFDQAARMTFF